MGWSSEEQLLCVTEHPCGVVLFENILIAIIFELKKVPYSTFRGLVKFCSSSHMLAGFSDGLRSLCAFAAWQTFTFLQQQQAPEVAVGNPSPY